jgi:hypothetical protein
MPQAPSPSECDTPQAPFPSKFDVAHNHLPAFAAARNSTRPSQIPKQGPRPGNSPPHPHLVYCIQRKGRRSRAGGKAYKRYRKTPTSMAAQECRERGKTGSRGGASASGFTSRGASRADYCQRKYRSKLTSTSRRRGANWARLTESSPPITAMMSRYPRRDLSQVHRPSSRMV